jgi:ACS family D-galactonate transporter-like MFS transporter
MEAVAFITTAYTVGATHSFTGPFMTAGIVLIVGILAYAFLLDQLDLTPDPPARGALDTPARVR